MTLVNLMSSRGGRRARVVDLVPLAAGALGSFLIVPFLHERLRATRSTGA